MKKITKKYVDIGGSIKIGDEIIVLPSLKTSRVKEIYVGDKKLEYAFNPQSALITLEDEIDVSRGDMIVRSKNLPIQGENFEAIVKWFSDKDLDTSRTYLFKNELKTIRINFEKIRYKFDILNLSQIESTTLALNEIGRVNISSFSPLAYDVYSKNKNTGSFIIIDELSNETVASGIIVSKGKNVDKISLSRNISQKGAVLWFTGLSGSGKSTIAEALKKKLIEHGFKPERLDGDEVREHLTRDLGFNKEDRDKNLDKVSYVAGLLSKHGVLVLATFVSPYISKRDEIRGHINNFIEIYVNAPLDTCIKRDVKGLYKKALTGNRTFYWSERSL
jgi:bifunctional enzyme CysN/CysC